jgi:hypothetical protein
MPQERLSKSILKDRRRRRNIVKSHTRLTEVKQFFFCLSLQGKWRRTAFGMVIIMKSSETVRTPGTTWWFHVIGPTSFSNIVWENRKSFVMVNWNWVSKACSSNTEVLLSLNGTDIIKLTLCNLTSNLMFQTQITCVNASFAIMCINEFLKDLQRSWACIRPIERRTSFLIIWLIFSLRSTSYEEI